MGPLGTLGRLITDYLRLGWGGWVRSPELDLLRGEEQLLGREWASRGGGAPKLTLETGTWQVHMVEMSRSIGGGGQGFEGQPKSRPNLRDHREPWRGGCGKSEPGE